MSKSLDQLAKNLASGMSRRKALWQFFGSLGVVAAFSGRKASACGPGGVCREFCEQQAQMFMEMCLEASETCPPGYCAEFTLVGFNGGAGISVNGSPHICVPVSTHSVP
jgi:hypothetical protein